jgi:hypothetical protein
MAPGFRTIGQIGAVAGIRRSETRRHELPVTGRFRASQPSERSLEGTALSHAIPIWLQHSQE